MRKIILAVFLIQFSLIMAWGYANSYEDIQWVDKVSGALVKTGNPVDTVTSYFDLLSRNSFDTAASLMIGSKQKITGTELKLMQKNIGMESSTLVKTFKPSVNKDKAFVGFVRLIKMPDNPNPNAVVGINALVKNPETKEWKIFSGYNELPPQRLISYYQWQNYYISMLYKEKIDDFPQYQQEQIQSQLKGMYILNKQTIKEIQAYIKGQKQKKSDAAKDVYKPVDEAGLPLDGVHQKNLPNPNPTNNKEEEYFD